MSGGRILGLMLLAAMGCESVPPGAKLTAPDAPPSAGLDPVICCQDESWFRQEFDGHRSQIVPGQGWHELEGLSRSHPWGTFAWAKESASIYFPRPNDGRVDLVARCTPFTYDGAPVQVLHPVLNGRDLPATEVPAGWNSIRVPLPSRHLAPVLNELLLRFDHAVRPADKTGSQDKRRLSVACDYLAVVPRDHPQSVRTLPRVRLTQAPARLTVPLRATTTLPLPAARAVDLKLGEVSAPAASVLRVSYSDTEGRVQRLWQGDSEQASKLSVRVGPAESELAELVVEALPGDGAQSASADVSIALPKSFASPVVGTPPQSDGPPDIFIYMIDTLRVDALGVYGSARPSSPHIDRFAQDAVLFERAWSPSSWTLPATASILTGVYPSRHGLTKMSLKPSGSIQSLAGLLSARGYETIAVSQSYVASRAYGLAAGFDHFYLHDVLGREEQASGTVRWFLWQHLRRRPAGAEPLFLYAHTVDPHHPYAPRGSDARFSVQSPGEAKREGKFLTLRDAPASIHSQEDLEQYRALYDGDVLYADRQFGAFLDLLRYRGAYEESLIILVSDHGEEFGEHGGVDHGRTLYEELLHVPLLVKFPNSWRRGERIAARVSTVDIAPTVMDLAGVPEAIEEMDGVSLVQTIQDDPTVSPGRVLFAETSPGGTKERFADVFLSAAVRDDLKCIHSEGGIDKFFRRVPNTRVFDLRSDPGESSTGEVSARREKECERMLSSRGERPEGPQRPQEAVDTETEIRLRALGYLD